MRIHVGCCGFPGGMEKYMEEFETVEIQRTFYRLPKVETAEKWKNLAPKNFIFCVKCFQGVTHPMTSPTWRRSGIKELKELEGKVGYLRPTKQVLQFWEENLEICKILDARICLIQLPRSFRENSENLKNLEKFFSKIDRGDLLIAIELRGWDPKTREKVCEKFDLIDCTDPFKEMPTHFSEEKVAYLRLHGSPPGKRMYNYKYTKEDLKELLKRIKSLKVREAFVFFNNIYMEKDAKEFLKLVERL